MYVILVYDVNCKRVGKVLKIARKYLLWVQNSVLEGEITEACYQRLKNELRHVIKHSDICLMYRFQQSYYFKREVLGQDKGLRAFII